MAITRRLIFLHVSTAMSSRAKSFTPHHIGCGIVKCAFWRVCVCVLYTLIFVFSSDPIDRRPDDWSGKRIIVIGSGQSGTDISGELVNHAAQVTLIGKASTPGLSEQVQRHEEWVETVTKSGVTTTSGVHVEADVIMIAAGYKYDFSCFNNIIQLDATRNGGVKMGLFFWIL